MSEAYDRLVGLARPHPSGASVDVFYCQRCGAIVGNRDRHDLNVHANLPITNVADILVKVDEVLDAAEAAWGLGKPYRTDYPLGRIVGLLSELRDLRVPSGSSTSFSRSDSLHRTKGT
jgi:hypothetical protein